MANKMISVKIEGEEEQILQFSIPDPETFGSAVNVNGFLDDHQQYAGTEEIASLLGNPSSESLTLYKCEPMDQDEEIVETCPASEGVQPYFIPLTNNYDDVGSGVEKVMVIAGSGVITSSMEVNNNGAADSSSSSSNSDDDDNSSGSEDSGSSADDESRNGVTDSEGSKDATCLQQNQRNASSDKAIQQQNRRKRFKSKVEAKVGERKMDDVEPEKTLEHFVRDNVDEYLRKQDGIRDFTEETISKEIYASTINPEVYRLNSIVYGPLYEPQEVPEEIERFWEFYVKLKEKFPQYGLELKPVLVPMLLYFFYDCSRNGISKISTKLFTSFAKRFFQEDRSQEALNIFTNLSGIVNNGSLSSSEYLQKIQPDEPHFVLSEAVFEKLKRFLIQRKSRVLTHLFACKFVIQLKETAELIERIYEPPTDDDVEKYDLESKSISTNISVAYSAASRKQVTPTTPDRHPIPPPFGGILFDKAEQAALAGNVTNRDETINFSTRKAIYHLRNSVEANIPSIHLHTLNGRPVSAAISAQGTMFAFGMSTSVINVCFSTQRDLERFNMEKALRKNESSIRRSKHRKRTFKEMNNENGTATSFGTGTSTLDVSDSSDEETEDTKAKMINSMFGHEGPVYDLQFHPRTRLLFSVGQDCTLRAWDLNSFSCRCVYRGHSFPIWCMDITDTGHMIATGSMDTSARIWLPEKTEFVRLLAGHYFDIDCVKFHPNEAYVATGSVDKSIRLWTIGDGNLVRIFTGATSGLSAIAFHESGKYIIGGGEDSFIRIWDIARGETEADLPSPMGSAPCRRLAVSRNMLAAAFEDNTVRIWNLQELFGGNNRAGLATSESSASSSDSDEDQTLSPSQSSKKSPRTLSTGQPNAESDSESASSCSITEDELEPMESNVPKTAFRLPLPKIISCDSSSILALYYQDLRHLNALGSKIENSDPDPPSSTVAPETGLSGEDVKPLIVAHPVQHEPEPGVAYLPESMRAMLLAAGITRWPIPVERLSSSDDEQDMHDGMDALPKNK